MAKDSPTPYSPMTRTLYRCSLASITKTKQDERDWVPLSVFPGLGIRLGTTWVAQGGGETVGEGESIAPVNVRPQGREAGHTQGGVSF